MIPMRFIVVTVGLITLMTFQATLEPQVDQPESGQSVGDRVSDMLNHPDGLLGPPLEDRDAQVVQSITTSEWLGPLAPIAISPFFGITCLAGMSQFGGDYLPLNSFVSDNAALKSPVVFWIFLVLTLVTSVPRLTKVSKPIAQGLDQIETYAGIITILVLRFMVSTPEPSEQVAFVQMGFLTFSTDVLLSVVAIINIIVINTIKFFFEVLVWLIPIPFVDAILEAGNKALCVGLMAIYAWSPIVATVINLCLFTVCFLAFKWVKRRVTFFRTMLTEPIWAMVSKDFGQPTSEKLTGFLRTGIGPFPAKAKVLLKTTETGWRLTEERIFFANRFLDLDESQVSLMIKEGMFINSICLGLSPAHGHSVKDSASGNENLEAKLVDSPNPGNSTKSNSRDISAEQLKNLEFHFSRRFNGNLDALAAALRLQRSGKAVQVSVRI